MTTTIHLFTIGFTKKNAETFFKILREADVKRVIDTRLNNVSQLAGFTKKADLAYFLKTINEIDYIHLLDLAPTADILDQYKKEKGDWQIYEQKFLDLLNHRQIEKKLDPALFDRACLLCSEAKPHHCHRRLVAEYLNYKWGNITLCHL